jgi:hypothetical protein
MRTQVGEAAYVLVVMLGLAGCGGVGARNDPPKPAPEDPSDAYTKAVREEERTREERRKKAEEERARYDAEKKAAEEKAARDAASDDAKTGEAEAEEKKLAAAREKALAGPAGACKLEDLINDPKKYAGQVVKLEARVTEIIGPLSFSDEWASTKPTKIVVAPPFKTKPGLGLVVVPGALPSTLGIDGLKGARVAAVVYVSKTPAAEVTDETACIGRILDVKVK